MTYSKQDCVQQQPNMELINNLDNHCN